MACHELNCHRTGEIRENYLNQLRCILERAYDVPCLEKRPDSNRPRPLLRYPGYVDRKNPRFNEPFYVPTFTRTPCKEARPREEIASKEETLHGLPRPTEILEVGARKILGGQLLEKCECNMWNGLQDSCPQPGCKGRAECMMKPPQCGPSQAPPPTRRQKTRQEMIIEGTRSKSMEESHSCSCPKVGRKFEFETPEYKPQLLHSHPCHYE